MGKNLLKYNYFTIMDGINIYATIIPTITDAIKLGHIYFHNISTIIFDLFFLVWLLPIRTARRPFKITGATNDFAAGEFQIQFFGIKLIPLVIPQVNNRVKGEHQFLFGSGSV